MKAPGSDGTGRLTLTVEEAAKQLGIGRTSAYAACRAGQIPILRVGRRLLIPRTALEALLASAGLYPMQPDGAAHATDAVLPEGVTDLRSSRNSATPGTPAAENPFEDNELAEVAEVAEVSKRGDTPQHLGNDWHSNLNMFDVRCPKCGLHGRLRPAPGGFRCDACQTLSAAEVVA